MTGQDLSVLGLTGNWKLIPLAIVVLLAGAPLWEELYRVWCGIRRPSYRAMFRELRRKTK